MAETKVRTEYHPVVLQTNPALDMDEEQFFEFCQQNKDVRIERTEKGELEVMPPTGGETGNRNTELTTQLQIWARQDNTGAAFDSSTGFVLPNGAVRAPDAAWVRRERLAELTAEQKRKFIPLCPDFVIELRSPTDSLALIQGKMQEYLENGARLGWLVDPEERKVHIYQPNKAVSVLESPGEVSGDPVLTGFVLGLQLIWEPRL